MSDQKVRATEQVLKEYEKYLKETEKETARADASKQKENRNTETGQRKKSQRLTDRSPEQDNPDRQAEARARLEKLQKGPEKNLQERAREAKERGKDQDRGR